MFVDLTGGMKEGGLRMDLAGPWAPSNPFPLQAVSGPSVRGVCVKGEEKLSLVSSMSIFRVLLHSSSLAPVLTDCSGRPPPSHGTGELATLQSEGEG